MNESHVLTYGSDETVTVTPIDANHCPGAAMFLFEGQFGRILYTGDFRYSGPMLNDINLDSLCSASIDVLYLDNTFCDPRCIFPSREKAIIEILRVIRSYPDARIKIGLRTLGKEYMLVQVARSIGEWIGVSQERYCILEILCVANVFEVSSSCRIQVVMLSEITGKNMTDWNLEQQTVAIIPTAIGVALGSAFPQRDDVHVIPYSDHSSYEELQQFVSLIKPRKILPILGPDVKDRLTSSLPNRANMSCFQVSVTDDNQVHVAGNNFVMSEQQALANSSYNTRVDESTVETTQPKTRKTTKRKGCFSFKQKKQMGVVYTSESPIKRTNDLTGNCVVAAADSAEITAEQSKADPDADAAVPTEVICLDFDDNVCDTTTARSKEQHECYIQSEKVLSSQQDSVHPTSDDRNLMNSDAGENDQPSSNGQGKSAVNLDCQDYAWMLQVLQPLISQEANKIIFERQSFCRSFRK